MNSPIVFLDFDDVLCLNEPYTGFDALDAVRGEHAQPERVLAELFAAGPVAALTDLHARMDGRLRYVISSSWRESFSRPQLLQVLRGAGLALVADHLHAGAAGMAWCTPCDMTPSDRLGEIEHWLTLHHRREPFIVLDDELSGASLGAAIRDPHHVCHERVILCGIGQGLQSGHIAAAAALLRRPLRA